MGKIKISAGGPSYVHSSVSFDCQRTINMYGERGTTGSVDDWVWIGRPGLKLFGTVTSGTGTGNRCLFVTAQGRCFTVVGNTFTEVLTDGTTTNRGTLLTVDGRVSMADNGTVIMVVDGTAGYFYNLTTNTFTQITDVDFIQTSSSVVFLDGYFIFNNTGTGAFGITDLYATNPASCIDGYQTAQAEYSQDNIVGIAVYGKNLFVFGSKTYQVFYDSGDVNFPFEPVNGAAFDVGCGAINSIITGADGVYWLGEDKNGHGIIYQTSGYGYKQVSNSAITAQISGFVSRTDAIGSCVSYNGHQFYEITFPNDDYTFVYDSSTGLWVEWQSTVNGRSGAYRGVNNVYFADKNIVGDISGANLYWLDSNYYKDNYGVLTTQRIFPHINNDGSRTIFNSMILTAEIGIGLTDTRDQYDLDNGVIPPAGTYPQIWLNYSDDGSRNWTSDIFRSMGAIGVYKTVIRWDQLGCARDRVFKLTMTDPVKRYWITTVIDADVIE